MKKLTLFLVALVMVLVSCKPEQPKVVTTDVVEITGNSAVCGGGVSDGGGATIVERGFCWNTERIPTVLDFYVKDTESGLGSFTSNIPNLVPNTQYYIRAYAVNANGVAGYGEEVSFTTLEKLLPTVTTTTEVAEITHNSATCGGEVTFDGYVAVTAIGICWSTMSNPTIEDNKTTDGSGVGGFTSQITNLVPNTKYYVRAYATNEVGTAYGEEITFTTFKSYECVDLGLSVKWATCNVGATSPEEYGDYFAWGETSTKETYDDDNCPTYGLSISQLQAQGYIDGEGNLTPQHDAATANWGGDWRMPTWVELDELYNNCIWTWTTQNGVNGYKVVGPNGNSIFLPATGGRSGSSLYNAGSYGDYWSSTPNAHDFYDNFYDGLAYILTFYSDDQGMYYDRRYFGLSVRPVVE